MLLIQDCLQGTGMWMPAPELARELKSVGVYTYQRPSRRKMTVDGELLFGALLMFQAIQTQTDVILRVICADTRAHCYGKQIAHRKCATRKEFVTLLNKY